MAETETDWELVEKLTEAVSTKKKPDCLLQNLDEEVLLRESAERKARDYEEKIKAMQDQMNDHPMLHLADVNTLPGFPKEFGHETITTYLSQRFATWRYIQNKEL